jgi:hypothetical protein
MGGSNVVWDVGDDGNAGSTAQPACGFRVPQHNASVHADPWSSGECRLRTFMTRETIYVVQAFNAGKGKSLRADVPIPCRSAETARRTAERLAPAKAGVVAFSTAGDAELGDYDDEPTIIFKTGQLPAHFQDT